MSPNAEMPDYEGPFASAVADFWSIKRSQQAAADARGTSADSTSGSVRGGAHMAPFEALIRSVVADAGIVPDPMPDTKIYVPGYYRETKSWDVVIQHLGHVVAIVEAKSQGSSLANNFNNRVEEAIGQAADIWKSHERNLLVSGIRPWVGYVMIVEETDKTTQPKHLVSGKFIPSPMTVDQDFDGLSYAERYAMAFQRLDQERMLDATCVAITRDDGSYQYPSQWMSFNGFAAQLWGRCRHILSVLAAGEGGLA